MERYTAEVVIDRPRDVVFDRLRRFEDYPAFMETADEVERLDGDRLRWTMSVGPITRTYEARITAEEPPERIAWQTDEDEVREVGEVRLHDTDDGRTRVGLTAAYDLDNVFLQGADAVGFLQRKVEGDLDRLKAHIERT
jgi:uncharacterized membrane protein